MGLSWWHILLVLLVFVLLFGTGKISGLMGDVAKGIKSFKTGHGRGRRETKPEPEPTPPGPKVIEHKATKPASGRSKIGGPRQDPADAESELEHDPEKLQTFRRIMRQNKA